MQVKCNCMHLGDLHAFLGYAFCSCVCIVELLLICKGRNGMTRITNGMEGRERERVKKGRIGWTIGNVGEENGGEGEGNREEGKRRRKRRRWKMRRE